MSARWVTLLIPRNRHEREIFGEAPFVIHEASRGPGREVRLASDQETGIFGMLALPKPLTTESEVSDSRGETGEKP